MYRYMESIFTDTGRVWDVYAIKNDSTFTDDCIAITGPDAYLQRVYAARNSLETFTALIRTDYRRDIAERGWAEEKYKLDDGDFVGADFAIETVHDKSIDAMVYDYLRELYFEIRDTDIDELVRICKSLDRDWIEKDQKETLRMIDAVRTLVAHKL